MPVRLDKVPAALKEPSPPRGWLWGMSLVALMALGVALALWFGPDVLRQSSQRFWWLALVGPALAWFGALFLRGLLYIGRLSVVESWNETREAHLTQMMRRGRRSQQVLAVSLQTALRTLEADGQAQRASLLAKDGETLRTQVGWRGQERRHSRLPWLEHETEHQVLKRALSTLWGDLADALAAFPPERPVALLLEKNTELSDEATGRLWQESFAKSGIRQALTPIEGSGLAAIDRWLDQHSREQALLLVVAIQVAPPFVEGSAEAVVGLLLGNRLTQNVLLPRAYLHRPEPVRELTHEGALKAVLQALDWALLPAKLIGRVWIAGAERAHSPMITSAMESASLPAQASHVLDESLGNPGSAAPWVAVAAAVEAMASEAVPQFFFSGDNAGDASLWCSVVMPAQECGE